MSNNLMNEAKKTQLSNQASKWIIIMLEIGILLFSVGLAWATVYNDVEQNANNVEKHDKRITCVQKEIYDVKSDIREIKTSQKYISDGIKEIKDRLP